MGLITDKDRDVVSYPALHRWHDDYNKAKAFHGASGVEARDALKSK